MQTNVIGFLNIFKIVFSVICYMQIFRKCGEKGYKAIIPFYSDYIQFSLFWNKKYFPLYMIVIFLTVIFGTIFNSIYLINMSPELFSKILNINKLLLVNNIDLEKLMFISGAMMVICYILTLIMYIKVQVYTGLAFEKGVGFILGLIFLNVIFIALIAFSNSTYFGNQYELIKQYELKQKMNNK